MINFFLLIQIFIFVFLIYLSYLDFKYNEISNWLIGILLIFSVSIVIISRQYIIFVLMAFVFLVGLLLYHFKAFGGADVKLLPCLFPFMLINAPNILVGAWFYLIMLLIVGGLFALACKLFIRREEVPFIPAIAFSYLIFEIFKFVWIGKI